MNNPKSKKVTLGAATLLSLTTIGSVQAENISLKFHSGLSQSRPEAEQINRFASLVSEKSDGELDIEVYHAGALGLKEADMLRVLQQGMVDMALLYGEYYTRDAPALASVYAQGAITESSQHDEILDVIRELYEDGFSDWDIQIVGGVVAPIFDVGLHCKEPVHSLADLQDKKVRVWSRHLVDTFELLGISAQVIPQNDMYMALQTGVVDCAYYLSTVAPTVSLQEVTEYESYLHPWAASPWLFGISEQALSRLNDNQRQALEEAGEEIWNETRATAVDPEREAQARQERKELGITMLPDFSDDDVETFVDAAWQAWQAMAENAGEDGTRYYETVTQAISEE
ncbi:MULTISPECIES: TRAP transporter substrate-binding protein DctP [unclassified Halomonas]|uniref:TRAP transporter substrate-binding protein DctP n=1 Tax=unclassified Halomonas TaxID=2609666 RepID=UPI00048619A7|nr:MULTISPECIES: TRAP transporter substrate-binding protein DctP [unclassified Halomonas]NAO94917.1 C4-dicarboxylate ABC transporter substrate-binding protein [Halomonas sp. MG34]PKH63101.1 C4-dicarboxylate ABC transporter substrate-binding protein [Halomonas sp. Choline-3u-9]QGQ71882.1 C4-dicarboxylate ABC transporter substrate-binding protein [Halomonas sp. PA16-9]